MIQGLFVTCDHCGKLFGYKKPFKWEIRVYGKDCVILGRKMYCSRDCCFREYYGKNYKPSL